MQVDSLTKQKEYIELNQQESNKDNLKKQSLLDFLPQKFTQFLQENEINLDYFQEIENFPRYIRLKIDQKNISLEDLKKDLNTEEIKKIEYLHNFYQIPSSIKIVHSKYYSSGLLYGIDLSSASVVKALDPQEGEKILDLCCCPGMKLCYIADIIGEKGKAIGVDINETRLNTCKSIVRKYRLDNIIKLELADGTSYDKESDFDRVLVDAECTHDGSLKHLAKFLNQQKNVLSDLERKDQYESIQNKHEQTNSNQQGDEVNTADISIQAETIKNDYNQEQLIQDPNLKEENIKYIQEKQDQSESLQQVEIKECLDKQNLNKKNNPQNKKDKSQKISNNELKRRRKQMEMNNSNIYTQKKIKKNEWTIEDFEERVLDPFKLNNIVDLQKNLLINGFKRCKEGGIIVYSTCSFARNQNEDVVSWFLSEYPNQIQIIHPYQNFNEIMPCKPGFIEKTIRFDPFISKSGGMFVSKFIKLEKK